MSFISFRPDCLAAATWSTAPATRACSRSSAARAASASFFSRSMVARFFDPRGLPPTPLPAARRAAISSFVEPPRRFRAGAAESEVAGGDGGEFGSAMREENTRNTRSPHKGESEQGGWPSREEVL